MKVYLNGKDVFLSGETPLVDFVRDNGFRPERVVIQHNGRILTREEWSGASVRENDRIDVLQFVGGG
ncbi:MAG: sulfur carrier protein ThiS [Firmicutes bacterium]|nr:sulfur carrier protein ThiS [Bacillota bacterium]